MAIRQVYTCDRCGEDFEPNLKRIKYRLERVDYYGPVSLGLDLCPNCYSKLVEWFEKGKTPMTRLERAMQDPEIRGLIRENMCPRELTCMTRVSCTADQDCEACWNEEYIEGEGQTGGQLAEPGRREKED